MANAASINNFESPSTVPSLIDRGGRAIVSGYLRRARSLHSGLILGHKVTGLGLPLVNLHAGSRERASKFYCGKFDFLEEKYDRSEDNIFSERAMSAAWQQNLHGFSWLVDMQVADRELARAQSRSLICEWMIANAPSGGARWFGEANKSDVLARRVISWVHNAPFFLKGCPDSFANQFFASLSQQVRSLYRRTYVEKIGLKRLQAALGLVTATIGLDGLSGLRPKAFDRLTNELESQILGDGGHVSRNPQILRDLLADLVPVRMALEAAHLEVPSELNAAIERMLPALRFFSYPDGGLAVFNGVNDTRAGLVRRILETDTVCGAPVNHARHSGYVKMQQVNSTVMIDTGKPMMPSVNADATAGVLAFEFCDGGSRIVTNCGATQRNDAAWSAAARSTQAHSGLCLDDQPIGGICEGAISRLAFGGPVVLSAPNVTAGVSTSEQGIVFTGSHDGYDKTLGVTHERQLFLDATGVDFRGQDSFFVIQQDVVSCLIPFAVRFHLHPSVRATISQDGASAMLLLANKTGWRFSARGAQLKLEDSVYLPEKGRVRKSSQLVLRGAVGQSTKVLWAFKRIEKRKGAKAKTDAPKLL